MDHVTLNNDIGDENLNSAECETQSVPKSASYQESYKGNEKVPTTDIFEEPIPGPVFIPQESDLEKEEVNLPADKNLNELFSLIEKNDDHFVTPEQDSGTLFNLATYVDLMNNKEQTLQAEMETAMDYDSDSVESGQAVDFILNKATNDDFVNNKEQTMQAEMETAMDYDSDPVESGQAVDFILKKNHERMGVDKMEAILKKGHSMGVFEKVIIKYSKKEYKKKEIKICKKKKLLPLRLIKDLLPIIRSLDILPSDKFVRYYNYYNRHKSGPVSAESILETLEDFFKNQKSRDLDKGIVIMKPIDIFSKDTKIPKTLRQNWKCIYCPLSIKPNHIVLLYVIRGGNWFILDSGDPDNAYDKEHFSKEVQDKLLRIQFVKDCPHQDRHTADCLLYVVYYILQLYPERRHWRWTSVAEIKSYMREVSEYVMTIPRDI